MSWSEKWSGEGRRMRPAMLAPLALGLVLALALAACGGDSGATARADARSGPSDSIGDGATAAQPAATSANGAGAGAAAAPAATPEGAGPVVLFYGTSLTAGLGLDPSQSFPQRVAELAAAAGTPIRVVNAGLSGETSAGALRRADWVLGRTPADIIVLETGANDGLRAFDVETVRANIDALVATVRRLQPRARVLLIQMEALPNLGPEYTRDFRAVYPAVADKYGIPLIPFLLDGVAGVQRLNQEDGVHPTAEGARMAARTVWSGLGPVVREISGR